MEKWKQGKSHDVKHVYCPPRRDDGNNVFSLNAVYLNKEENRRSNSPARQTSVQQSSSPPRAVQDSDQQGSNLRGKCGTGPGPSPCQDTGPLGVILIPQVKTFPCDACLCFWRMSDHAHPFCMGDVQVMFQNGW